jgi:hypothetical protein
MRPSTVSWFLHGFERDLRERIASAAGLPASATVEQLAGSGRVTLRLVMSSVSEREWSEAMARLRPATGPAARRAARCA